MYSLNVHDIIASNRYLHLLMRAGFATESRAGSAGHERESGGGQSGDRPLRVNFPIPAETCRADATKATARRQSS